MTATVEGRPTAPTAVPNDWRGPLPDASIKRQLPYALPGYEAPPGVQKGWTAVPEGLLHGGFQDLAVLVWAQLRLWFQDDAGPTNYLALAAKLGLDSGSPKAVQVRFSRAVTPLLGTWIIRERLTETQFTYRAVSEHRSSKREPRYAIVSRAHLAMIAATRETTKVKPADIVDFARWQLECGQRGWTADTCKTIAKSWKVTPATVRASRRRLADLRFLEVVDRGSRFSELVWLKEVYNPFWMVRSTLDDEPDEEPQDTPKSANLPTLPPEQKVLTGSEKVANRAEQKVLTPISLPEVLTDDLTELGGTSVPTLTLLPRDLGDAPPPATRSEERVTGASTADHRHAAACLVGQHRVLAAAKPYFRTAMIKRLTSAFEQGLAPGHVDRALALVAEDALVDAECLIVKQALQQAWIAQRVGMCPDCGDRDRHSPGCPQFDFSWDDAAGERDSSQAARHAGGAAAADPVALLLQRPVPDDPDSLHDAAEITDWMTVQLARQIVDAPNRDAALRAAWTRWRTKLPPGQRDLLDRASEHVRYALALRRVS